MTEPQRISCEYDPTNRMTLHAKVIGEISDLWREAHKNASVTSAKWPVKDLNLRPWPHFEIREGILFVIYERTLRRRFFFMQKLEMLPVLALTISSFEDTQPMVTGIIFRRKFDQNEDDVATRIAFTLKRFADAIGGRCAFMREIPWRARKMT